MSWTEDQVLALAPDASAARAGRGQAVPSRWMWLGSSERALWGLCRGSGARPYQTAIDLQGRAFSCSCPSRKIPCKHALGLMVLWTRQEVGRDDDVPEWVTEWLQARDERAAKRAPAERADEEAGAKRAARREDRIAEGIAELRLWLDDLVRQGLAQAEARGSGPFAQMAARLVDAQAPGLARRVRGLGATVGAHSDWPARVLERAGLLALLIAGYERQDALPEGLRAEVRSQVGWTVKEEDLKTTGERIEDRWAVVAQTIEEDERLTQRRTWLVGDCTTQAALLLDFAYGSGGLPPVPAVGHAFDGELVFYPSSLPQRAVIAAQGPALPDPAPPAAETDVDALHEQRARALAANPWADRLPVRLRATPVLHDHSWWLADDELRAIQLLGETGLDLAAVSGGRPVTVFGEWRADGLDALTVWAGHGPVVL